MIEHGLWLRDSNRMASGKPGAVQIDPKSAANEMQKFARGEQNSARSVRDILTDAKSIFAATN